MSSRREDDWWSRSARGPSGLAATCDSAANSVLSHGLRGDGRQARRQRRRVRSFRLVSRRQAATVPMSRLTEQRALTKEHCFHSHKRMKPLSNGTSSCKYGESIYLVGVPLCQGSKVCVIEKAAGPTRGIRAAKKIERQRPGRRSVLGERRADLELRSRYEGGLKRSAYRQVE